MLQTLTLSYPGRSQAGPKVLVLFTNLSRYQYNKDDKNYSDS